MLKHKRKAQDMFELVLIVAVFSLVVSVFFNQMAEGIKKTFSIITGDLKETDAYSQEALNMDSSL